MILKYFKCLGPLSTVHGESNCPEGWEPYLEKKCFKILPDELKNYDLAQDLCNKQGSGATLLTIHSQQEQDFLSDLLFTKYKIVDSVWIGASVSDKKMTWVDESTDDYTNWEPSEPSDAANDCVQMEPAPPNTGKWVDVACNKQNKVVCQNGQQSTHDDIQRRIDELQANQTNMKQTILDLTDELININILGGMINELRTNQTNMRQLPNQPEPTVLWPKMYWCNVTPSYAGLFFRAEGGASEKFNGTHDKAINETARTYHITPGTTTNDLYAGSWGGGLNLNFMNFLVSAAEVRPDNQAIRIWKRIH
ncbi:unnamed protein product [Oppiella nova]|uniref:C-type lectin domain-containing protein n=1 Tax=Oppiella nova TaxID=334625 RepID=A0A7R9QQW5_9ACAR|nr:unnamed protein product [Oppiella nova]CAG2172292.1 unnamed protein product [Oppiella nova]